MSVRKIFQYFSVASGIGMFIFIIINIILINIKGLPDMEEELLTSSQKFYNAFILLIFNPIFEGLFFRKILLERIWGFDIKTRSLLGGIAFAIPHFFALGIAGFLYSLFLGVIFAYVSLITGQLKYSAILHSMSNLYGNFLFSFFINLSEMTKLPIFPLIYLIIMPVVGIVSLVKNKKAQLI